MNCAPSMLFFVSSIMVLGHSQIAASLTCDQLPKVDFPSNEVLVANSPLQHDFVLNPKFDCTTKIITNPPRGTTGYSGTIISIHRTKAVIVDYTIGNDKKKAEGIVCSTGEKGVWYSSASHFGNDGAFLCVYSCNGTSLREFGCTSNNNGASPAELEAINLARQVPNGHLIHNARENCPESNGCKVF